MENNQRTFEFKARPRDYSKFGAWAYGGIAKISGETYIVTNEREFVPVVPVTVCEKTGRKDIHGRDIYQNDYIRVEVPDPMDGCYDTIKILYTVDKIGLFGLKTILPRDRREFVADLDNIFISRTMEVVGNKWLYDWGEDDELLEREVKED